MSVRGFSLIELVVTLVIAAILAAVAIPYFTDRETQGTWFHEQAKAAVRYAQRQAVAQRREVHVVVQSNRIDLCYAADCSSRLVALTTGQDYVVNAPSGVTIAPVVTFAFNALGQPQPIGGQTLNVDGRPIVVTAETGYVR